MSKKALLCCAAFPTGNTRELGSLQSSFSFPTCSCTSHELDCRERRHRLHDAHQFVTIHLVVARSIAVQKNCKRIQPMTYMNTGYRLIVGWAIRYKYPDNVYIHAICRMSNLPHAHIYIYEYMISAIGSYPVCRLETGVLGVWHIYTHI